MSTMSISFTQIENPAFQNIATRCQTVYNQPFAIFKPSECVLPEFYKNEVNRILDFEVREDDVWVISYPKCGTTWTQEMVWLLANNLDYDAAKQTDIMRRFPFIEFSSFQVPVETSIDWIDILNKDSKTRCIKSHLPKELLPRQLWTKKPKIVYVARNPKDVVLSYFHHHRSWTVYGGTLETFADAFLEDVVLYGPYWEHILDFWNLRDTHVLFNTYEEMKADLPGVIRKTAKFLGKSLTEAQISELEDHLSFKKMKENPSVNYNDILKPIHEEYKIKNSFMRKGEAGAWKKELPPEMVARIDAWSRKKLANSDFPFYR